jgi:hypothetical protein
MPGIMPALIHAFNRVNGILGSQGLKFSAGSLALTTADSAAQDTGLTKVLYVVASTTGATAGYVSCVSKTNGSIVLKANAAVNADWFAIGY